GCDLHPAQHDPAALQCGPAAPGAADLGDQPDLQGLRSERPGAARERPRVRAQHGGHPRAGGEISEGEGKGHGLSAVLTDSKSRSGAWRELWLITIGHSLTHWYPATFYLLLPLI